MNNVRIDVNWRYVAVYEIVKVRRCGYFWLGERHSSFRADLFLSFGKTQTTDCFVYGPVSVLCVCVSEYGGETHPKCSLSRLSSPSVLRVIQNPFRKVIFVKKPP